MKIFFVLAALCVILVSCSSAPEPAKTNDATSQKSASSQATSSSSNSIPTSSGSRSSSIDCATFLLPSDISTTCGTGALTMQTSELEGKYYNLCSRRFMSGTTKKAIAEVVNANQVAFDGHYDQYVNSDGSGASSLSQAKALSGIGEKAFQFKDGPRNRVQFRQGGKNMNIEADAKTCSFEQVIALAKIMSGRLPK